MDNKPTLVRAHEMGQKHRHAMAVKLRDAEKKQKEQAKEAEKVKETIRKADAEARRAFAEDTKDGGVATTNETPAPPSRAQPLGSAAAAYARAQPLGGGAAAAAAYARAQPLGGGAAAAANPRHQPLVRKRDDAPSEPRFAFAPDPSKAREKANPYKRKGGPAGDKAAAEAEARARREAARKRVEARDKAVFGVARLM